MVDSSLISPSKKAIPQTFSLIIPVKQSECQRLVRNLRLRRRDENWAKRVILGDPVHEPNDLALKNQRLRRCIDDFIAILDSAGASRASEPTETPFDVQQALRISNRNAVEAEIDRRESCSASTGDIEPIPKCIRRDGPYRRSAQNVGDPNGKSDRRPGVPECARYRHWNRAGRSGKTF
jgi:hypothetical protein